MYYFCKNLHTLIRFVEHYDWVIYCITAIAFSYVIMFRTLHRNISLIDFIVQKHEDSNNKTLSWFFTTLLFSWSFSLLFSQYLPVIPSYIPEYFSFFGFHLNKMGFMLVSLLLFYLIKNILIYIFYGSINELKKFSQYGFVSQKFFLVYSLVLLLISFIQYYFPVDRPLLFKGYLLLAIFAFVIKNLIFLLHTDQILPSTWYYKILYICTLQILPSLLLWKIWFL